MAKFDFIIIDIIDDSKLNSSPSFQITVDNPLTMWGDGNTTAGGTYTMDIPLRLQSKPNTTNSDFFVYPSPARDLLQIHLNGDDQIEALALLDAQGKEVYHSGKVQWEHAELNVAEFPAGFYVAVARTSSGQLVKKFQIVR